jgi:hypothetical protein
MTLPSCPLFRCNNYYCVHRLNYDRLVSYIASKGIVVNQVTDEPESKYWKGGKCVEWPGGAIAILIWRKAYRFYGWDMMASVIIHEFGHALLWRDEHLHKGEEAERKANRYGFCNVPLELVPDNYWLYREFFLVSHIVAGGWNKETLVREYRCWMEWMRSAPTLKDSSNIAKLPHFS